MSNRYSTRSEAIQREIIEPLEASSMVADAHESFDIDAIADDVLGRYEDGYAVTVDEETFWASVAENDLTEED